jgi:hypothetical protein
MKAVTIAHDVYAETNPAFCAVVLVEFTRAYQAIRPEGPETPVAYLAVPLALSDDLASAFDGTNKKTGLLEWLERRPEVQVGLAERLNASLSVVTEAIRFGCYSRLIGVGPEARLVLGANNLKPNVLNKLGEAPRKAAVRAGRLGSWFASAGSTRSVFDAVGLTL